jgi:predicted ATPase/DNA-binding CsgD family transcriptional regulator
MDGKAALPEPLTEREQQILARLSAGLSDHQIAVELFLSVNTVKWYNRQIYAKLGVASRAQATAHPDLLQLLEDDGAGPQRPGHNLPAQTTPFIGRRREIEEVQHLLHAARLLTLTGTGGTGKTRLALQVAAQIASEFPDGVYFVDLAPLSNHALVANAIAGALGVFENPAEVLPDTLKRALAQRRLLLLIDNFEHVMSAAPLVSEMLAASANLKVLATSRESLRLAGEQEYFVPPLSLPGAGAVSVSNLNDSEAVSLFVRRAQMTQPHFAMNDDNASAIARICARLDGLPLAIELAAARCKLLTPGALAERLEETGDTSPLDILASGLRDAPARHRTLRDTMVWSYNLLDEDEKTLFARLSVFRGGHSLEAIEAVCSKGLSIDVLDGLASLVDKSLVQQKEAVTGEPRFVLLEMIHEYARERLEASGEAETVRSRHAGYFVALAERAEPELRLSRYAYWCQHFEVELDNLRAVLEWASGTDDVTSGVRLAGALGMFWYSKGYHVEGIRWTQLLLDRLDEAPANYHARFLLGAGRLAWMVDLDMAARLCARGLEVSRALGDQLQTAWALAFQSYAQMREPEAAMATAESSLALFRDMNHQPGIAQALNIIGELARISGDDVRARRAYEECLAVCEQTGEVIRMCYNYANLAYLAQHEGDHARAFALAREALELARGVVYVRDLASFVVTYAGSTAALGQLLPAARLLGASEVALERMGAFYQPADKPEMERIVEEVRVQLDDTSFNTAWAEGREMSLEEAVRYALED